MKTCKDLLSQKVKFSLHKVFFLENLDDKLIEGFHVLKEEKHRDKIALS